MFLLFIFPLGILFGFLLFISFLIFWFDYNLYTKDISRLSTKNIRKSLFLFSKIFLVIFFYFFIFFFYILKIFDYNFKLFYINNLIINQLFLYSLFFICIFYVLFLNKKFSTLYPLDFGFIVVQLFLTTVILFMCNNLLLIFICLEIINIFIIYSFIITLQLTNLTNDDLLCKSNWLLNTLVYQFILNFFSSFFFFYSFNMLLAISQSSNFLFLANFSFLDFNYYLLFMYIAFFVKFGLGPWIFFKLEIYEGFNFVLLLLYTTIYFLNILPFIFNLFFIYFLNVNLFSLIFCLVLLVFILLAFSTFMFSYFNIFIFFSFSSLLTLLFIFLQFIFAFYHLN